MPTTPCNRALVDEVRQLRVSVLNHRPSVGQHEWQSHVRNGLETP
jgi:hypothetical protein